MMASEISQLPRQARKALVGGWLSRHADRPAWQLPVVGNTQARIIRGRGARLVVHGRLHLGDNATHVGYVARGMPPIIELQQGAVLEIRGQVRMADGTRILAGLGARVSIGDGTHFSGDSRVICACEVSIGDDCAIAWDVLIMDADFHWLEGAENQDAPVSIGSHVWIGAGAHILKGVTVGDGAVVGAGSLVSRDVPPACLAVGNPARVVREGVSWR